MTTTTAKAAAKTAAKTLRKTGTSARAPRLWILQISTKVDGVTPYVHRTKEGALDHLWAFVRECWSEDQDLSKMPETRAAAIATFFDDNASFVGWWYELDRCALLD